MKMTPELKLAAEKMKPGVISANGFFGDDTRDLATIISDQKVWCRMLGVHWETIADAMENIARPGLQGFGCRITVDGKWEVCADENRGKAPCPFPHPGMFQKTVYTVTNMDNKKTAVYTELSIHLIRHHGFFQGVGATFYNSPADLVELLELK